MEKKPYMVMRINYNNIPKYGDVFYVYANRPISENESLGTISFTHELGEETELFVFPQDEDIIRPIESVSGRGYPWEPEPSDFFDRIVKFKEGEKVVHYYNSLLPENKRPLMTIIPIKVSYDDKEWLYFDRYEEWSFSQQEIRTPHSDLSIYGAIELEQDGKTGIRLEIFLGLWRLDKLPCINKINSCTPISTIDITKHHGLPYLWIRMYNSDNKLVASFWGRDRDNCADNIIAYLNIMKATNNNRNKLV